MPGTSGGFEPVGVLDDIEQLADEELRNTTAGFSSTLGRIDSSGNDNNDEDQSEDAAETVPSPVHGTIERRTSTSHAVFHIFKANVGAGVFLLPSFYNATGAVPGLCLALITGIIVLDSTVALVDVKHRINQERVSTYSDVVEYVLGKYPRYFIDASLFITQCGFCVLYLQFSSGLLASLMPFPGDYFFFLAIGTLFVFPLTFFTHRLHVLAKASLFAAVCVIGVLGVAFFISVTRIVNRQSSDAAFAAQLSTRWVSFVSAHILALEGVGVILPVENSVADTSQFSSVMQTTLAGVTLLYVSFGQAGYVAFGSTITSSVLAALPSSQIAHGCQLALAVSLLFSYPLQFVPAVQIVDRKLGSTPNDTQFILTRAALNIAFALTAALAGSGAINKVAELLGAFVGAHLTIFFPTLLAVVMQGREGAFQLNLLTAKRIAYLLFAVVIWVGGTTLSIVNFQSGA